MFIRGVTMKNTRILKRKDDLLKEIIRNKGIVESLELAFDALSDIDGDTDVSSAMELISEEMDKYNKVVEELFDEVRELYEV